MAEETKRHRLTPAQRKVLGWMKKHGGENGRMRFLPGRKTTRLAGQYPWDPPGTHGHYVVICSWIVVDALRLSGYLRVVEASHELRYELTAKGMALR